METHRGGVGGGAAIALPIVVETESHRAALAVTAMVETVGQISRLCWL